MKQLTQDEANAIRWLYKSAPEYKTYRQLAELFGVSYVTIFNVMSGSGKYRPLGESSKIDHNKPRLETECFVEKWAERPRRRVDLPVTGSEFIRPLTADLLMGSGRGVRRRATQGAMT